ncbi:MAG: 50S ribosomal protein L9 [Myxococcota bacterium]
MMKIILTEDVPSLGVVGDLVTVRDGYGRNYLIPQGKAVFASVRSVAELDHQKRLAQHHRTQATAEAEQSKKQIEDLSVCMSAKVAPPQLNDDGEPIEEKLQKLFGSITNRDLAKVLRDSDIKVEHRRVSIAAPVRTVGKFEAKVRLNGGVIATLPFWVVPEGAEDIEAEKKRVEAAQEAARQEAEEAARLAAEAAKPKKPEATEGEEGDAEATSEDGDTEATED